MELTTLNLCEEGNAYGGLGSIGDGFDFVVVGCGEAAAQGA